AGVARGADDAMKSRRVAQVIEADAVLAPRKRDARLLDVARSVSAWRTVGARALRRAAENRPDHQYFTHSIHHSAGVSRSSNAVTESAFVHRPILPRANVLSEAEKSCIPSQLTVNIVPRAFTSSVCHSLAVTRTPLPANGERSPWMT